MNNEELVLLAQKGDILAAQELVINVLPMIKHLVYKKIRKDVSVQEEFIQECIPTVYRAIKTYDGSHKFTTWVGVLVKYRILDLLNRKTRFTSEILEDIKDKRTTYPDLYLAIDSLSEEDSKFILLVLAGFTGTEIAKLKKLSLARIYQIRTQVFARLRRAM